MKLQAKFILKSVTLFFYCVEYPFIAEFPLFKRFGDDGSSERLLKKEVMRYSRQMRNNFLSNEFRENLVQYEIREKFWPNTRICFSDEQHHETPYCFTVSDENLSAKIKGKLDHGVKHSKSGFKSLTFEDKAQDAELSDHIAHAVSQVEYEVKRMRKSLLYVPELYIGLLQNGRNWVAILRKVVCGEVLLTYVEAPPAFEVGGTSVSEVNDVNCGYIARLIEHAYCAANQITLEIMNPSMRPKSLSHSLEKMLFDEDEDGDDDDDETDDGSAADKRGESEGKPGGSGHKSGDQDKDGRRGHKEAAPGGGGGGKMRHHRNNYIEITIM